MKRFSIQGIILFAFAFLLYSNTIKNDYSLDDEFVTANEQVKQGIKAIPGIFSSRYYQEGKINYGYRPVPKALFAIEYSLAGENPHAGHFVNVILFALLCAFAYRVLKRVLPGTNPWLLFCALLFFVVHPVHTEVVASLKNREEILVLFAGLATIWFALNFSETKKWSGLLFMSLIYLLGYWSKSNIVTFVLVTPLALWISGVKSRKILLIVSGILIVVSFFAHFLPEAYLLPETRKGLYYENPMFGTKGFFSRMPMGLYVLGFYLKMVFYPWPMSFYYGYNMFPGVGWSNWIIYLSLIFHLLILGFSIWGLGKKQYRVLAFGLLFYLVNIAVYTNVLKPLAGIVADRYLFTASLGMCLVLAYMIFSVSKLKPYLSSTTFPKQKLLWLLMFLVIIPGTGATIVRNNAWKDKLSLFRSDIGHLENSVKANDLIATELVSQAVKKQHPVESPKMIDEALVYYKQILEIYPSSPFYWKTVGAVYADLKHDYKSAKPYFEKALDLKSDDEFTNYYLALVFQNTGDTTSALKQWETLMKNSPGNNQARLQYANYLFSIKKTEEAIMQNMLVAETDSSLGAPYLNIGNYYLTNEDTTKAVSYFLEAIRRNQGNRQLMQSVYLFYKTRKDSLKMQEVVKLMQK